MRKRPGPSACANRKTCRRAIRQSVSLCSGKPRCQVTNRNWTFLISAVDKRRDLKYPLQPLAVCTVQSLSYFIWVSIKKYYHRKNGDPWTKTTTWGDKLIFHWWASVCLRVLGMSIIAHGNHPMQPIPNMKVWNYANADIFSELVHLLGKKWERYREEETPMKFWKREKTGVYRGVLS